MSGTGGSVFPSSRRQRRCGRPRRRFGADHGSFANSRWRRARSKSAASWPASRRFCGAANDQLTTQAASVPGARPGNSKKSGAGSRRS